MSKIHRLKIDPEYYEAIFSGEKTFEVRYNDRNYIQGDFIIFDETEHNNREKYTGRILYARIGYVLDDFHGLTNGFCAFSLKDVGDAMVIENNENWNLV
jgi:hypothetical protein